MNRTILYIEDDADDRELLFHFLKKENENVKLEFADNGLKALSYLHEHDRSLPSLIVLDLNMPYLDGKETYFRLRNESRLAQIPVVVFTSSENPNDRELFESFGVDFITKPDEYGRMDEIAKRMMNKCKPGS